MDRVEEPTDDEEFSFAPTPSPEEARARLAALRGKSLDAPSRLVTEEAAAAVEPLPTKLVAADAPSAPPDLAATVAALVAESLKQMGRPAAERKKAAKADKPLFKVMKVRITTRIDADVLAAFKATGPGYQTLMNDVLRANMPSGAPAA
ncbi:BrnA antitoxin family protein [Mesorhizobium sp. M0050]|uniref:BrnA antitoxin family protein n=1 Tax=Mesorhizobium sp. M0050 TaxID=2956861 RepID=UPI0033354403